MSAWLLVSGDFTILGGMDRANHAQALFLAGRGDEVHVVAHRVAPDLRGAGVRVHDVPRPSGAHLLGAPLLKREAARQRRALDPAARVIVNGGNADPGGATWIHYLHAAYAPVVQASVRTRISTSLGRAYYLRRERAAVTRAPVVVCNSQRTAADVERHYGVPASRLRVVYYGIDRELFARRTSAERDAVRLALGVRDGRRVALFIGALGDRRKGFDALLDAWVELNASRGWDVDLFAAGTGAERPEWERRAAALGLGASIRFLGFRSDIASVIAAADVVVHPARYEAYGLGVHEAICRGLPAIVTASSGIAERYPAALRQLLIPDPPAAAQLAATLRTWRADADAWPSRFDPFAEELRRRSWDDMAADIAAIVEAA